MSYAAPGALASGPARTLADGPGLTIAGGMIRPPGVLPACLALAVVSTVTGCGDRRVPLPELPQLTQARELGGFGADRLRDSDACRAETNSVETLIACMERRGWTFVRRWGPFPSDACWGVRAANDPRRMPEPMCFERAAAAPPPQPGSMRPGTMGPP